MRDTLKKYVVSLSRVDRIHPHGRTDGPEALARCAHDPVGSGSTWPQSSRDHDAADGDGMMSSLKTRWDRATGRFEVKVLHLGTLRQAAQREQAMGRRPADGRKVAIARWRRRSSILERRREGVKE